MDPDFTPQPAPDGAAPAAAPSVAETPAGASGGDGTAAAAAAVLPGTGEPHATPVAEPPVDAALGPGPPSADDGVAPAAAAATPDAPAAAPQPPELAPAECAARLAELFPALFAGPPKPIKLRIHVDVQQRAAGVFTRRTLSVFLHRHTTSTAYLKALVDSPQRLDLDGQAAGPISDEHRDAARAELERRRALADQRRAAQREQQRQAQRKERAAGPAKERPQPPGARPPGAPHTKPNSAGAANRPRPRRAHDRVPQPTGLPAEAAPRREDPGGDPARLERARLLRAWETSTLSRANFLALKRMTEADFDAQIALARQEAAAWRAAAARAEPPGAKPPAAARERAGGAAADGAERPAPPQREPGPGRGPQRRK
jgi:sRNA-binding protein